MFLLDSVCGSMLLPVSLCRIPQAVTLNCAHSFCSYCINEWMKRKVECPICRQEIKSKTRSLVLDNCINRMVEKLDVEMKQHRLNLIRERKGERWVDVA